ncbi:MAG: glycosyltransferase family 4 protein [Chitinivibrionales bacterium]
MQPPKLLFLGCGPEMPKKSFAYRARFEWLSKWCSGYIITPVSGSNHMKLDHIASFAFLAYIFHDGNCVIRNLKLCFHTITKALALHLGGNTYDVIVAPNPLLIGLIALLLGKITGAKVMIEVKGNLQQAFKYGATGLVEPGVMGKIKHRIAGPLASSVIGKANLTKYMYEGQLNFLAERVRRRIKLTKFPDFVPISLYVNRKRLNGKYILLLGYPWYLKGVDILIQSFKMIADDFPRYSLKIVGWCPTGKDYFQRLAGGHPRIQLCGPVYYDQVPQLMCNCSLFVLASRTEALGRVLIEAMASRKPIIASNVDGIPSIIRDGYNGLLFESENAEALAEKMRMVLSNYSLARSLARNGYTFAKDHLSEEHYTANYRKSVEQLIRFPTYENVETANK